MTQCLRLGDMEAATEQKRRLEEKQRAEERKRENLRAPWRPKYFIQEVTWPASGAGEDWTPPQGPECPLPSSFPWRSALPGGRRVGAAAWDA